MLMHIMPIMPILLYDSAYYYAYDCAYMTMVYGCAYYAYYAYDSYYCL